MRNELFGRILEALETQILELFDDPLNELRGHLTESILRGWIQSCGPPPEAAYCALHHKKSEHAICAYLLSSDYASVYNNNGKRCAVAFTVKSFDAKIADALRNSDFALLYLGDKGSLKCWTLHYG